MTPELRHALVKLAALLLYAAALGAWLALGAFAVVAGDAGLVWALSGFGFALGAWHPSNWPQHWRFGRTP